MCPINIQRTLYTKCPRLGGAKAPSGWPPPPPPHPGFYAYELPSAKVQHMWAQSLYILCGLLRDKLIAPGEIDPLNRRLCMQPRHDPIVQGMCVCVCVCIHPVPCMMPLPLFPSVVLLAEDQQLWVQLK